MRKKFYYIKEAFTDVYLVVDEQGEVKTKDLEHIRDYGTLLKFESEIEAEDFVINHSRFTDTMIVPIYTILRS